MTDEVKKEYEIYIELSKRLISPEKKASKRARLE